MRRSAHRTVGVLAAVLLGTCLFSPAAPAHAAPKPAQPKAVHPKPGHAKPAATRPGARKAAAHPGAHEPTARIALENRLRRVALEKAYIRTIDQANRDFATRSAALAKEKKKPDYKQRKAALEQGYRRQRATLEVAYQKRLAALKRGGDGRRPVGQPIRNPGVRR